MLNLSNSIAIFRYSLICLIVSFGGLGLSQNKVVGYMPTYSNFVGTTNDTDFSNFTHINVAFAYPTTSGGIRLDVNNTQIRNLVSKAHEADCKVLISIGGGGADEALWESYLSPTERSSFISNVITYLNFFEFDGIDVDLENNLLANSHYNGFVQELHDSLPQEMLMTGAFAQWNAFRVNDQTLSLFDFINAMAYDVTGPWTPNTPGPHSPMSKAVSDINYWKGRGLSEDKIVLGVPFYGWDFGSQGIPGLTYRDIINGSPGAESLDEINDIYYNGQPTIQAKTELAMQEAGGIMIWEITQDIDFEDERSLLRTIVETMNPSTGETGDICIASEFWDDFSYQNSDDPAIASFGWDLMNRNGWPGENAPVPYLKSNVAFDTDPEDGANTIMKLSTNNTNELSSRSFSRIQWDGFEFFEGVFAARVKFSDVPGIYQDGNIQTFYLINNDEVQNVEDIDTDTIHAEIDFEYLDYDVWGGGNFENAMHFTTWESYVVNPWTTRNAHDSRKRGYTDRFYNLYVWVENGDQVRYLIDDGEGNIIHTKAEQNPSLSVYPDRKMQIAFANWIWSNPNQPLGPSISERTATMEVDWVYHAEDATLSVEDVLARVASLKESSTGRLNTISPDETEVGFFKGTTNNDENTLSWMIKNQDGIANYHLYHSSNGIDFNLIQTLPATNETWTTLSTTHIPQNGLNHYRLEVESIGGNRETYCEEITLENIISNVTAINTDNDIEVYPNPFDDAINIENSHGGAIQIDIYDALGQPVYSELNDQQGTINLDLDVEPGVYMIQISNSITTHSKVLLKK